MPQKAAPLRRPFQSRTRAIDPSTGTVQFVASSQAIDSYNEVVSMKGWDGSRLEKNAPVVDSHNYSSIECLLGKITNSEMSHGELIQDVQFAISVPENTLAQKAFAMIQAGFLSGCSIGFLAVETVSRFDAGDLWDETIRDLGLGDLEDSISRIYTKWQQLELSVCCIGSNPDALVMRKSFDAGILNKEDLERWPSVRRAVESLGPISRRSFSLPFPEAGRKTPSTDSTMSTKSKLLSALDNATASLSSKTLDQLESSRRGQSEAALLRAAGQARLEMAQHRRHSTHEAINKILLDDEKRRFLNTLPRVAAGVSLLGGSAEHLAKNFMDAETVKKSLTFAPGNLGATLLPIDVSLDIFDLVLINGAFKDLGFTPMSSMFTKFAQTIANPQAFWITPSNASATIAPDVALTGSSLTPEANSLAVLLPVSRELLQDEKADLSYYLLSRFSQAIAAAIDYASLQGNGNNDTTNGSQTGIFIDNTITSITSAQGNTLIPQLVRSDFISVIAAVAPAALQRPCRWFISPSFIAPLMLLADSQAKEYLLKTPADSGDGEWYLCGFPVTWCAQGPANNVAGSKIAAFGHGPSYMCAVRQLLEVILSDGQGFASNQQFFRAIARAFCQTRQSSGLVTLTLSPN